MQAPISNNQKHPTADRHYAPLPSTHTHTHSFEEPFWCYYSMIVIQHWMRQFDVGAEWCSPSHCGSGLEYRTQFQTHVSVIYRSAFHHPAVQGLRNACTALPGLSACRLCPPLLASDRHTLSHWCMHKCTHTSLLGICASIRQHARTGRRAALLHYTPPWLPDDYFASPIITRVSVSPLENLRSSASEESCDFDGGGCGGDDNDDDHTSFLFFPQTALHELPAGQTWAARWVDM